MYTKHYETNFSAVDKNSKIKVSSILHFMQNIAAENADALGFGFSVISPKNIGWYLLKYHIKFYGDLKKQDEIILKTQSLGANRLTFMRDFEGYMPDGNKFLEATSCWVLVDLNNHKTLSPKDVFDFIPTLNKEDIKMGFGKIIVPDEFEFQKEFHPRYDDLDVNGHVNNSAYFIWANETLPFEILNSTTVEEIEMNFKKEVTYGMKIISKAHYDKNDNCYYHLISNEQGEEMCIMQIRRKAD